MGTDLGDTTLQYKTCPIDTSRDTTSEDFGCYICYEVPADPVVTHCGHLFCKPCIHQWLHSFSRSKQCPICKGHLNDSKLISIRGRGRSSERPGPPNDIVISLIRFMLYVVMNGVLSFVWNDFPLLDVSVASISFYALVGLLMILRAHLFMIVKAACFFILIWIFRGSFGDIDYGDDDNGDDDYDNEDNDHHEDDYGYYGLFDRDIGFNDLIEI